MSRNPFDIDESLADLEGETDQIRLARIVCAREIEKVLSAIKVEAGKNHPKNLWLIKDPDAANMYNVAVAAGVFRGLVISGDPRFFPVYVALPIVFATPLKRIYELMADRLQPKDMRNCVYTLITEELKGLVERGEDKEALPEVDVPGLIEEITRTDGIVLDEILFPPKPAAEAAATEEEEKAAGEEEITPVAETSVSEPEDPRREALINFIEGRVRDETLSFPIVTQNAIVIGMRDGFEKGREALTVGSGYRDALAGIIRLISYFYHKILIFIDQVEMWEMFSDTEKAAFLGVMTEFGFLSGGRSMLVFASELAAYKAFDPNFTKGYKKINLNLRLTHTDLDKLTSIEETEKVLIDFLEADPIHKGKSLSPFTRDDVKDLVKRSKGNILKILEEARKLLDSIEQGRRND